MSHRTLGSPAVAHAASLRRSARVGSGVSLGAAAAPGGGGNLYRQFGISEDADYDTIMAAYEKLCAKFEGNKKELIKLEVSKDRILEDRLRRRMTGTLQSTVVESAWDKAQRMKKRKSPQEYLPGWMQRFVELPQGDFGTNMAILFGLLCSMPLLAPTLASTSMCFSYLIGNAVLYNRGLPNRREDDMRPAKLKPLLVTLAISTIWGGLGFSIGVAIGNTFFPMTLRANGIIGACTAAGLGVAATFFKVQEDE